MNGIKTGPRNQVSRLPPSRHAEPEPSIRLALMPASGRMRLESLWRGEMEVAVAPIQTSYYRLLIHTVTHILCL